MLLLLVYALFLCQETTNEQSQGPSRPLWNSAASFIWYTTPADEVTSVSHECGQWQDERTALSSTLINDVNESKHVDDKGEVEVFCGLLSRHLNDVGSEVFGDADKVVGVQQTDDAKPQNSCDQLANSCTRPKNPVKSYACDVCHKTFVSSSSLQGHKHVHTGLKTHRCDVCHKSFTDNSHLARHKLTHTGGRLFVCDICTKVYIRFSDLKRHRQTHTGDESNRCDVCHKIFAQRGNLKAHMLTHTGEKPHQCDVCHNSFVTSSHLNRHMLTHASERPHKCGVCQKQFTQYGNLKRHLLTHSGDTPHKCGACHKQFIQYGGVKTHMLTHTGECTHTETTVLRPFVRDYPSEPVPKETLTHPPS